MPTPLCSAVDLRQCKGVHLFIGSDRCARLLIYRNSDQREQPPLSCNNRGRGDRLQRVHLARPDRRTPADPVLSELLHRQQQPARGKNIFQNLILRAHEILKPRSAAFVFGFPNDNSYPLFTMKLGYRELPSRKIDLLNIPVMRGRTFQLDPASMAALEKRAILQNDTQLIELKRRKYGTELLTADFEGSTAWGVRRSTVRKGIRVPSLDVGGIDLKDSSHLQTVLRHLRKQAPLGGLHAGSDDRGQQLQ
jgi:hypothetical protein